MYSYLHVQLAPLYKVYSEVVKPLIAEIEARFEEFPAPIHNEIRAYNDHVARCYFNIDKPEIVDEQVNKAKGHIERIVLDCYKYLNVRLYDETVVKFTRRTKRIDLTAIGNGDFYIEYRKHRQFIIKNLKKAKLLEFAPDKDESLKCYKEVHSRYTELELLIDSNDTNINWAKAKFRIGKMRNLILWLLAAVASGVIIPELWRWIQKLF